MTFVSVAQILHSYTRLSACFIALITLVRCSLTLTDLGSCFPTTMFSLDLLVWTLNLNLSNLCQ